MKVKTFEAAADFVARDFAKIMKEEGFETFREMQKCYCWEPEDIRDEIMYTLEETEDCWMYDDGSTVVIGFDDMPYGTFKRMVLDRIKKITGR